MPKAPRLAAGRARALGQATRGTTNPNRLRRMDRWMAYTCAAILRTAADPLVIDLGYGSSPVTVVELAHRLRPVRADVRVLGIEIDPDRVAAAQERADPPRLEFVHGGFDLAGRAPLIVRAANVLRQYPVEAVDEAWATMTARLAPGGVLIDGTCDEIGRRSAWIALDGDGPRTLTVSMQLGTLARPSEVEQRLPKALIHRNIPGEGVHEFLRALDSAWAAAAPHSPFGARQRFVAASEAMARDWPVRDGRARWRLGELTVDWAAVAPR